MTDEQLTDIGRALVALVREWESRMYPRTDDEYADFVADARQIVADNTPEPDDGP